MSDGAGATTRSAVPPDLLHYVLHLPASPISVRAARAFVGAIDTHFAVEELDRIQIIVSELITNAITHGSHPSDVVEFRIAVGPGYLEGSIRDCGPAFDLQEVAAPVVGQVGGFGLHIARRLADNLNVRHSLGGNTVSFTVHSPAEAPVGR